MITSPLNFLWLESLETAFPGTTAEKLKTEKEDGRVKDEKATTDAKKESGLNVKNTIIKVFLDQTVGAAWITLLFLITMGILRGQDYDSVVDVIKKVSQFPRGFTVCDKDKEVFERTLYKFRTSACGKVTLCSEVSGNNDSFDDI